MIPLYYGTILNGKMHLPHTERAQFVDYLKTLEGKEIQIMVEKRKDRRTISQNAYLWGVVYKLIANHTGFTPEEVHEYCKRKFLGTKRMMIGAEPLDVQQCTHEVPKDRFFEEYIDPIRQWAAQELQVVIPDPNQVSIN